MVANRFPQNVGDLEVDRTEQKCCLFSGLFEEELELNGVTRKFYTYLTPGLLYNQRCLVVAPPDHVDTLDYLEASGWMALADREKIFLHVLTPLEGSWVLDGSDADYMNKVYSQIQARNYYVTMQDNIYAVGIGRGASVAQQAAMKMTSEWSGLVTFGDLDSATQRCAPVRKARVEQSLSSAPRKHSSRFGCCGEKILGSTPKSAGTGRPRTIPTASRFPTLLPMRSIVPVQSVRPARSMRRRSPKSG